MEAVLQWQTAFRPLGNLLQGCLLHSVTQDLRLLCSDPSEQMAGLAEVTIFASGFV